MPAYRAESLIKTMILGRCRRQRMGLAVCSAAMFAATVASILAKVRNAEKDPQPLGGARPGVRVMRALRVSVRKAVVAWAGRGELDLSPGRDRLLRRSRDELTITGHSRGHGIERDHDTLKIERDAGRYGSGPESDQSDHLRWYYFQCAEPAVDDVQPDDHGQDDEHRLTRAWRRGGVEVAHASPSVGASDMVPSEFRKAASSD